jgi:hypothetical protein
MGGLNELIAQLRAMPGEGDPESLHSEADQILRMALRHLGQHDLVDAYEAARDRVGFWYA